MRNPKTKKLRGKHYIQVDPQIELWRKHRKQFMPHIEPLKVRSNKCNKPEPEVRDLLDIKLFE